MSRSVGKALSRILAADHDTVAVQSGREALARLESDTFDVVLCDLMMPEMTGMDLYEELRERLPDCAARMVFLSGGAFTPRARRSSIGCPTSGSRSPWTPRACAQ
jgi:CheY-like chemotaxis protein